MDALDPVFGEPPLELLKACDSVGKDFMLELATCVDETDIELQFGDVNAEHWFCHDGNSLDIIGSGAGQTCKYKLSSRVSGFGYCPTSMRCAGGCRELV